VTFRGFAPLSGLSRFLGDLNPPYARHAALAFSVALLVPYLLTWAGARIDEKWVLTHYEVERRRKFAQRESLPRGGLTIDAQYNDMLKFILGFGGGSLRILDRDGDVLREIRWVFFLRPAEDRRDRGGRAGGRARGRLSLGHRRNMHRESFLSGHGAADRGHPQGRRER
jgi:hypothetical protein